jgi:HAD superfamily hydrolase (TIGR01509 family)
MTFITYNKIHFSPLTPISSDILIEDIAHALSLMCRANGHFPKFYSVAQHCIVCCKEAKARGLSDRVALACLLHDASEAYLADITRPVKKHLDEYHSIEDHLLGAIFDKYLGGITPEEQYLVKKMDNTSLYYEFYHFMGEELLEKPSITKIPDFSERPFKEVEQEYLDLFYSFHISKPEIYGVLFDMDGIILDSEKIYSRFWKEAANELGYPMTYEQALGMRSLNREMGKQQIASYFGSDAPYQAIKEKRIELMDAYVAKEGIDVKPGVFELLDYLKSKGIRTAIATSSPYERAVEYLSAVGLDKSFDKITSGHMVEKGKPEPDIYLYAASQLGLALQNCLAVEDSPAGLLAAKRAGCYPVMIPDQDLPTEETKELLFAKFERIDEIIKLIERFN